MEYEYNLMVGCLDRNVEGFMKKLERAMRPRRRAWDQVETSNDSYDRDPYGTAS